ncbi:helix-turn-helix domain-containing protein [Pararhizobium sp.]|uniref:helix-turn-helix domain-containing protein n=1 Tax=Pararhizobium sp. TaxID=1977563 RepID=UPI003D13B055
MNRPQTITLDGATYVVLSESDYEDLFDRAEASAARARIKAGEETYPDELLGKLLDGANPIRTFREWRGMKAGELAASAGIGQAYLSEIETGKKDGSAKVLKAIAQELDVDMELLIIGEEV